MVAIVTGAGLGLERTSGFVLGSAGALGDASFGRFGDRVTVNAATGNLVINRTDEILIGRGPDNVLTRTYNSLGLLNDDNGDNWQLSAQRRVGGLTGTVNATDSTITRYDWDGSSAVYIWDAAANAYVSKEGAGAYDRLTFAANVWTWTDGTTQLVETYDALNNGRITAIRDTDNNKLSYAYNAAGQLSRITTASTLAGNVVADYTDLVWTGNNLTEIVTSYTRQGREAQFTDQLYRLYDAAHNRAPDSQGFSDHLTGMLGGLSLDQVGEATYASPEYEGNYHVSQMSNAQYVEHLYTSVLRRPSDPDGKAWRLAQLDSGALTRGQMLVAFSESDEHKTVAAGIAGRTPPAQTTMTRTRYTYDSYNRLTTVTTDLTPIDGLTTDNKKVVTTYGYVGTSRLVNTITQADGVRGNGVKLTIAYDQGRVQSYTQVTNGVETSTTTFAYDMTDLNNQVTTVTDMQGQATRLTYDGNGQLKQIELPPAQTGATPQKLIYAYNPNGDVMSVTDGGGKVTSFDYDAAGNLTFERDAAGNTVTRTYGAKNELLTETRYTVADPDGAGAGQPSQPVTTRFAYDAKNHLTFMISAGGDVTRYIYDYLGQRSSVFTYRDTPYDVSGLQPGDSLSDATMISWVGAQTDLSTITQETTTYDFRGNVAVAYTRAGATAAGLGAGVYAKTSYLYDQYGNLLSRQTDGIGNSEWFVYDGLGRVTSSHDLNDAITRIVYDDGNNKVVTTFANGLVQTATYSRGGQLYSFAESGSGLPGGTVGYRYDNLGRLRVAIDATGRKSHHLYDAVGRKVADISADGGLTEYRYDAADRLITTIRYATPLTAEKLALLADASGNPLNVSLAEVRPVDPVQDAGAQWEWRIYDKADRLTAVVDSNGGATKFDYDGRSNLIATTRYANQIAAATIDGYKTTPPVAFARPLLNAARDSISRVFYDADGQKIGALGGTGYLTETIYNGAGEVIETIAYAGATGSTLWAAGTFDQLKASAGTSAADVHHYFFYDGHGRLRYELDANLRPTQYQYDLAGNLIATIDYGVSIAPPSDGRYSFAYVEGQVSPLYSQAATRKSWQVIDPATGRVAYTVDAMGGVVAFGYDAQGRVIKKTAFATGRAVNSLQSMASMDSWASPATGIRPIDHADNRISRIIYDQAGRVAYEVDGEGYVTEHQYDAEDRVLKTIRYPEAYAVGDGTTKSDLTALIPTLPIAARAEQSFTYDPVGRLSTSRDGNGMVTRYVYDALDRVTDKAVADGTADASTIHYVYDAAGRVASETRGYGRPEASTISFTYDALGNRLSETDGLNHVTTWTYDALGRMTSVSRPIDGTVSRNLVTRYEYGALGNVKITDAGGGVSYSYADKLGRLWLQIDAEGYATRTSYDAFGNIEAVTRYGERLTATPNVLTAPVIAAPGGVDATTAFVYDKLDRLTRTTDATAHFELYGYNAFGDRIELQNKLSGQDGNPVAKTLYSYDRRGLLRTETAPTSITTRSAANGALIAVVTEYSYDERGNLETKIEAKGSIEQRTTSYTYSKADQLLTKTTNAVAVLNGDGVGTTDKSPVETYKYDARGNLIQTIDANGGKVYLYYDGLDRKIAEIGQTGTLTSYKLDLVGNIISRKVYATAVALPATPGGTPPAGAGDYRETVFNYDYNDRLTSSVVKGADAGQYVGGVYNFTAGTDLVTTYAYDKLGNVIQVTDPNGGIAFSYYDKLSRKIVQIDQERYTTFYTYDAEGNVVREQRTAYRVSPTYTVSGLNPNRIGYSNFSNGTTGWTTGADSAGIVKSGSPYSGAYQGKSFIKSEFSATAADQVVSIATTFENSFPVTAGERLSIQAGVGTQGPVGKLDLVVWWVNAAGQGLGMQEVATLTGSPIPPDGYDIKLSGFLTPPAGAVYARLELYGHASGAGDGSILLVNPMVTTATADQTTHPAYVAGAANLGGEDRITLFSYDRNGRRLTETRLNAPVDNVASVNGTTGDLVWNRGSATISYAYNGLGQVTQKTEANGDYTRYRYDALGRLTRSEQNPYADYRGTNVTPAVDMEYNGLNDLVKTIQRGDGTATAGDRTTIYTYAAGGRLTAVTDPASFTTSYYYDAAGHVVQQRYVRARSDGSSDTEATLITYDLAGRERSRRTATLNGSAWTYGDSSDLFYNAYGEVTARGTNTGGSVANAQEFADYDKAGRISRTNFDDGVTRAYAYDRNGNATMLVKSVGVVNLRSYADLGAIVTANGNEVSKTISTFDKRNQLTGTIQPSSANDGADAAHAIRIEASGSGVSYFEANGSVVSGEHSASIAANGYPTNSLASVKVSAPSAISLTQGVSNQYPVEGFHTITLNIPKSARSGSGAVKVYSSGSEVASFDPNWHDSLEFGWMYILSSSEWLDNFEIYQETAGPGSALVHLASFSMAYPGHTLPSSTRTATVNTSSTLLFTDGNPSATRIKMFARPVGSSAAFSAVAVNRYNDKDGVPVPGWFAANPSQPPFSNFPANSAWEIKYLAMDDAGSIYDSKQGTLTVDGARRVSTKLTPQLVGGAGQAMLTREGSIDYLILSSLPGNATSARLHYRASDTSGGWATRDSFIAYEQAGFLGFNVTGIANKQDVWVELLDGSGRQLSTSMNVSTGWVQTALALNQATSRAIVLTPPPAQNVTFQQFRYRPSGSATWSGWIARNSGGAWTYDGLAPDFYADYNYDIEYETYNGTTLLSRADGPLTIGFGGHSLTLTNRLQGGPARVQFLPQQSGVASLKLYWRIQGTTGDFNPVTIPNVSGQFAWDIEAAGLRPPSGSTRKIEYYYDAYDVNNSRLPPLNGDDHVYGNISIQSTGYTTSTNNGEIRWVIDTRAASDYLVYRKQGYNAFGEIVSETDGRNNTTRFEYNALGRLTRKINPLVGVTSENGVTVTLNPIESWAYDISGRLIGMRDANSNQGNGRWYTKQLLAGTGHGGAEALSTVEFNPDGTRGTLGYDIFGDLRASTNGLNATTLNFYDANGRLIEVRHPLRSGGNSSGVQLIDYYAYDGLGQRIRHTNNASGYAGLVETADYDRQGRVVSTRSFGGLETRYAYSWWSIASGQLGTTGLGNFGGTQTVTTNSAGLSSYENRDVFDRVTWRRDFGGAAHDTSFVYDNAGNLRQQTGTTGQSISFTYYQNGYVSSITDNALGMKSTFEYDNDGNRTLETYNSTAPSPVFYQNAAITYDAMNRMTRFLDAKADISYKYDANGNRRQVYSYYHDGLNGSRQIQNYWYKYDSMNRFTQTMGTLSGGQIVNGDTGVLIEYDAAGNRKSATYGRDGHREDYSYTADGYLENVTIGGVVRSSRTNDALGRVTTYRQFTASGGADLTRTSQYDRDNRVTDQVETDHVKNETTTTHNDYRAYDGSGYSGADQGVVTHSSSTRSASGASVTTNTNYYYQWWDEAKQSQVRINATNPANPNSGQWAAGYADFSYDVNGHIVQMIDHANNQINRMVNYKSDAYGQVLVREEWTLSTLGPRELHYYFNGRRIGDVSNDGPPDSLVDYAQELAQSRSDQIGKGQFRHGKPVASADFDQSYQPINSGYPGAAASSYTVRSGDTLQSIALAAWGDASLWYLIGDANGLLAETLLVEGQMLVIPNKVTNFHNNSSTFRPYNPGEAIGDTLPTLPPEPAPPAPKHKNKCGVFGMILLAVVAVAVTVVTAGAAVAALAPAQAGITGIGSALAAIGSVTTGLSAGALIGVGAAAGALGSIVSQGLGVATGIQDKFSWKGVALGALAGAVGGAVGPGGLAGTNGLFGTGALAAAGRGAAASILTQGLGVATGLQNKFDWAGVAAAGVGGGVGKWVGGGPVLSGAAGGLAGAAAASLVTGRDFGDTLMSSLPSIIANTIGNLAADRLARSGGPSGDRPSDQGGRSPDEIVINREVVDGALRNLSGPTEYDGWSDDMRISLLEFDGRISSDTAAMIRARAVEIKIAARDQYEAENSGSGYSYKNFENGRNAIDHSTLAARTNDLDRFEAAHPGDKDIAPARAGLANNAALVDQWDAMAHKEVNGLIRMFVPPLDTAMSTYSIATGTGTWMDGVSVGGAALPGVVKGMVVFGRAAGVAKGGANFMNDARLLEHLEKHGAEFGVDNADDYLQIGRDIMQYGQKVQYTYKGNVRTGYTQFMGNARNGRAKFGFVGTNANGAITTIHVESGNSFWKMLNGNIYDKVIKAIP